MNWYFMDEEDKYIIEFEKIAKQNHPLGQAFLGQCYETGYGVEKSITKAIELYKKSSKQNHPLAQAYLGQCYENGYGVEKSITKAVELYKKSADQNHPSGQNRLGNCYENGLGVEQSAVKAAELYIKSYSFDRLDKIIDSTNENLVDLLRLFTINNHVMRCHSKFNTLKNL